MGNLKTKQKLLYIAKENLCQMFGSWSGFQPSWYFLLSNWPWVVIRKLDCWAVIFVIFKTIKGRIVVVFRVVIVLGSSRRKYHLLFQGEKKEKKRKRFQVQYFIIVVWTIENSIIKLELQNQTFCFWNAIFQAFFYINLSNTYKQLACMSCLHVTWYKTKALACLMLATWSWILGINLISVSSVFVFLLFLMIFSREHMQLDLIIDNGYYVHSSSVEIWCLCKFQRWRYP